MSGIEITSKCIVGLLLAGFISWGAVAQAEDTQGPLTQVQRLIDAGQYDEAIAICLSPAVSALGIEPQRCIISAYIMAGRDAEADAELKKMLTSYANDAGLPDAMVVIGQTYLNKGNTAKAQILFLASMRKAAGTSAEAEALNGLAKVASARIEGGSGSAANVVQALKGATAGRAEMTLCLMPVAKTYLDKRRHSEAGELFRWIEGQQVSATEAAPEAANLRLYIEQCDILVAVHRGSSGIARATDELVANHAGNALLCDAMVRIGVECFEVGAVERNDAMLKDGRSVLETVAAKYAANQKTADRVKFMLAKTNIAIATLAGDLDAADRTYASLKADFAGTEKLASAITDIAMIYHTEGFYVGYRGKDPNGYFARSAAIIENDLVVSFVKKSRLALVYGTLASDYERLGDYARAAEAYTLACETDPEGQRYGLYMEYRKMCYLKLLPGARGQEAGELAAKMTEQGPAASAAGTTDDVKTLMERAGLLREGGDISAARELYSRIVAMDTTNENGIRARVNLVILDIAEDIKPADSLADCNSSQAAYKEAEDAARKCYSKARLLRPSEPNVSQVLFRQSAAAADVVAEYLKPAPDRTPRSLSRAGLVYGQELGEYAKAIKRLSKAAADWPGHEVAPQCLGLQVQYVQRMGQAKQISREEVRQVSDALNRKLVAQYPNSRYAPRAAADLGNSLRFYGDPNEAITYLIFAIDRTTNANERLEIIDDLAVAYKVVGRKQDAIMTWREWLQKAPADHRERERISKNLAYLEKKGA